MIKYQIWLAYYNQMSSSKIIKLIQYFGSAKNLYYADDYMLSAAALNEKDIDKLKVYKDETNIDELFASLQELGLSIVCYEDSSYPMKLRAIADPPYALFYKGKLPDPNKYTIAIVGARGRSAYGEAIAIDAAKYLASLGIQIISGLALGIDADAHKGAIMGGGLTYAVLGCGVEVIYPPSNKYLYKEVEASGGIISEFPPKTQAKAINFPKRNRIISALSDCVIVIEAKKKSGSLLTADFALEQGKEIYALPGRVTDSLSEGCNQLIRMGANMFLSAEELVKDLQIIPQNIPNIAMSHKVLLEKEESLLYSLIDFCPTGLGKLMEKSGMSLTTLIRTLAKLKEKTLVKEVSSNYFVRTIK